MKANEPVRDPNGLWRLIRQLEAWVLSIGGVASNHAIGDNASIQNPSAGGHFATIVKIASFTPSKGGSGKVRCTATTVWANADTVNQHPVALGIKAVAAGSAAPNTSDYPNIGTTGTGLGALGIASVSPKGAVSLIVEYGGGGSMPAALTPGTAYDIYLMATSDDSNDVSTPAHGSQLSVQEIP